MHAQTCCVDDLYQISCVHEGLHAVGKVATVTNYASAICDIRGRSSRLLSVHLREHINITCRTPMHARYMYACKLALVLVHYKNNNYTCARAMQWYARNDLYRLQEYGWVRL